MKISSKKIILILITIACMLLTVAFSSCGPKDEPPQQEPPQETPIDITYSLKYNAGTGGWISGKAIQTVNEGENGLGVTAIADSGYSFICWSDGFPEATRQDKEIRSDLTVTAKFERKSYKVSYSVGEGGSIQGKTEQKVKYGENAETVSAVPDEGYKFVGWSDGLETAERQDLNIRSELNVEAYFEEISITLTYDYKLATDNCNEENITLSYFEFKAQKLIVPVREHFTFDGWYLGEEKISDENGNLLIGKEIFGSVKTTMSAKWTANETFTYKILLVFVTEFYGDVLSKDKTKTITVNYNMPEIERQICHAITKQLKRYLDDLLDGLVDFQVDEYFTTVPLGTENLLNKHELNIYRIPEVQQRFSDFEDYGTALLVYNFNDYDWEINEESGAAHAHTGYVHLESTLYPLILNNEPIDNLLDLENWRWIQAIDTYIHEMIHTIEMKIDAFSYHNTISAYFKQGFYGNNLEIEKYYLLNCANVNGEVVGIPYEFWAGEISLVTFTDFKDSISLNKVSQQLIALLPDKKSKY